MDWREIIGYTGSVLVAVSLMMGNIWRLRWINLGGALFFTAYGVLVHAYPVAALNGFIVLVNAYYLVQMIRQRDYFSLLELPEQSELRDRFLEFYRTDIQQFFPGFDWKTLRHPKSVFVLRNLMPVGLFAYEVLPDGTQEIVLDYVAPPYRDLKNAHYVFATAPGTTFIARSVVPSHQRYLRRIGFQSDAGEPNHFRLTRQ